MNDPVETPAGMPEQPIITPANTPAPPPISGWRRWFSRFRLPGVTRRRLILFALLPALCAGGLVALANVWVIACVHGRMYGDVNAIPARDVGLVLGMRKGNYLFEYRIAAASALYQAGKVRHLIVSGDNHVQGYDEPSDMKEALVRLGVPAGRITCDYAGFRTLDSIVRAKMIFGQDRLVIISQKFHNYRALLVARRYGLDAVALNARDLPLRWQWHPEARELLARTLAVIDLYVLHRRPRYLGPREKIVIPAAPAEFPRS